MGAVRKWSSETEAISNSVVSMMTTLRSWKQNILCCFIEIQESFVVLSLPIIAQNFVVLSHRCDLLMGPTVATTGDQTVAFEVASDDIIRTDARDRKYDPSTGTTTGGLTTETRYSQNEVIILISHKITVHRPGNVIDLTVILFCQFSPLS